MHGAKMALYCKWRVDEEKQMRKPTLILIGLVVLALAVTGCGGGAQEVLPPPPTDVPEPALEPTEAPAPAAEGDGPERIAFLSDRDPPGLYVMDITGENIQPVITEFRVVGHPDYSPDGSQIAFWSHDQGGPYIYVVNADGSGLTQVTDFSSAVPHWSPDGGRLMFNSDHDDEPNDVPDLYAMNLDGSNLVEIVDQPETADFNGRWSPDGSRVLFVSDRTGNYELFVVNVDGSNPTQLTNDPGGDIHGRWSPDGSKIAFVSDRDGDKDIYVMSGADGSNVVNLTDDTHHNLEFDWSPDGTRLVYSSNRQGQVDLYMINADGTNEVQLTNDPTAEHLPIWQP
jgi:Tol biopolymer transport system component